MAERHDAPARGAPVRSWTVRPVWGDEKFAGEIHPALNAMRRDGNLPEKPREVCDTKPNVGNGYSLRVHAACLEPGLILCTVRDHGAAVYVALVQDNGVVA